MELNDSEYQNNSNRRNMQKTDSNDSNEETDQLIKGTLVEGSEPIKGLEVYLKPGETSDDKMLQFKFQ